MGFFLDKTPICFKNSIGKVDKTLDISFTKTYNLAIRWDLNAHFVLLLAAEKSGGQETVGGSQRLLNDEEEELWQLIWKKRVTLA